MDKLSHNWQVIITAFTVGMILFAILNWGPVTRRFNILEPKDPGKALKIFFIFLIALWVVVGVAMSIGLFFGVLGAGG